MKKKHNALATVILACLLTINVLPVKAAEANDVSPSGEIVLQNDKVNSEILSKSEFLEKAKSIKAEFPEAGIDLKIASKEYDAALKRQSSQKLADISSKTVNGPKEVYSKVKDDGTILTLKVYAAALWETTKVTPGNCTGNYYSGTLCEVANINSCTWLGVSFRVDHTTSSYRNNVERTYSLSVTGFPPDPSLGIGVSILKDSGSYAEIFVNGVDLYAGIQYFHGHVIFNPRNLALSTSYVWD